MAGEVVRLSAEVSNVSCCSQQWEAVKCFKKRHIRFEFEKVLLQQCRGWRGPRLAETDQLEGYGISLSK